MAGPIILGPGAVGVRVRDELGKEHDLPEPMARELYPSLFPQEPDPEIVALGDDLLAQSPPAGMEEFAMSQGQPQLPPWEIEAQDGIVGSVQPDDPRAIPSPQDQLPAPTGSLSASQGAPGDPDLQSRSVSVSGPVRTARPGFKFIDPSSIPTAEERMSRRMPGFEAQAQGVEREAAGQMGLDQLQGEYAGQAEQLRKEHQTDLAVADAFAEKAANDKLAEIQARRAAIPQEDPKHYWNNASNFDKGALMLTAAINGFLNPGAPNQAVNLAMELVERDLRSQRANIAGEREEVAGMERDYERLLSQQDKERMRLQEGLVMRLETLKSGLEKEAAQYQSEITRGKYQQVVGQLDQTIQTMMDSIGVQYRGEVAKAVNDFNQANFENQRLGIARGQLSLARRKFAADEARGNAEGQQLIAVGKTPDGQTIYVPPHLYNDATKDEVKTAMTRWTVNTEVADVIRDMQKATAEYGKAIRYNPTDKSALKEYQQAQARFVRAVRREVGANLPEGEAERVLALAPPPTEIIGDPEKYFELQGEYIRQMEVDNNRLMQQRGFVVGDPQTGEFRGVGRGGDGPLSADFQAYGSMNDVALEDASVAVKQLEDGIASYQRASGDEKKTQRLQQVGGLLNSVVSEIERGGLNAKDNPELYQRAIDAINSLPEETRRSILVTDPRTGFPQFDSFGDPAGFLEGELSEQVEFDALVNRAMQDIGKPSNVLNPAFYPGYLEKYGPEVVDEAVRRLKGG